MRRSTARISERSRSRQVVTERPRCGATSPGGRGSRGGVATPVFQSSPVGTSRPRLDADHLGSHGLPHVDEGVAGHQHVAVPDRRGDPRLLACPATRWSSRTPRRRCGAGANSPTTASRSSITVQHVDHDPLHAQVVAPHLLDQFGVVDALDQDPAGPGDPGTVVGDGDRAAVGHRRRAPRRRRRRGAARRGVTWRSSTRNSPGSQREPALAPAAVAQGHLAVGAGDHLARRTPPSASTSRPRAR